MATGRYIKLVSITGESKSRLVSIGTEIGNLCAQKNEAYGDSFFRAGEVLKHIYPDGVKPEHYTDMLAIIRILDKIFRIATRKDAFGESPYRDIAGYGILGVRNDEQASKDNKGGGT